MIIRALRSHFIILIVLYLIIYILIQMELQNVSNPKLPNVIMIGVRKGGTTAIMVMLSMHSKIARIKGEVHFFDENYSKG